MKRMSKVFLLIAVLFLAISLTSCGTYSDGTSVWGGGLFILPWLTGIGSVFFFYLAYRSSKSNSTTSVDIGTPQARVVDNTGNVPIYKIGYFYFSVICFIATLVIIFSVNAGK